MIAFLSFSLAVWGSYYKPAAAFFLLPARAWEFLLGGFLAFYILIIVLLGMILDSSSILLIMTPVAAPIAAGLGMNLIHFGVITVLAVEIGLLTPPFGLSIFTVKSTLNDPSVSVESIFAGAFPYVVVMLITVLLIVVFPQLTLALL